MKIQSNGRGVSEGGCVSEGERGRGMEGGCDGGTEGGDGGTIEGERLDEER